MKQALYFAKYEWELLLCFVKAADSKWMTLLWHARSAGQRQPHKHRRLLPHSSINRLLISRLSIRRRNIKRRFISSPIRHNLLRMFHRAA